MDWGNVVGPCLAVGIVYFGLGAYISAMAGTAEPLTWIFFWPALVVWRAIRGFRRALDE